MSQKKLGPIVTPVLGLAALLAGSPSACADALVGDFEGNLNAGAFGAWSLDHTVVDDSPDALPGIISSEFLTDAPETTVSEGVTSGAQSLVVEHYLWQDGYKPYLSLGDGFDVRQAILDSSSLTLDLTPILPEAGWDTTQSWRQALLAFSYEGAFGKIQRDYAGEVNENNEPQTDDNPVFFSFSQFVENDLNLGDVRSWKDWAQDAIDNDHEMELILIFQGQDIDEDGVLIDFNPFNPVAVRTAVDNIQFNGLTPPTTLVGDYNDDGLVNAADYTVWRDNVGADGLINRDPGLTGPVGPDDLNAWSANFGAAAAGAGAIATPEPMTLAPALLGVGGMLTRFRGRSRLEKHWRSQPSHGGNER